MKICFKTVRLDFAREHTLWVEESYNKILFDKKEFNLNGLEGFRYHYRDLTKEEKVLSKRQMDGVSFDWLQRKRLINASPFTAEVYKHYVGGQKGQLF